MLSPFHVGWQRKFRVTDTIGWSVDNAVTRKNSMNLLCHEWWIILDFKHCQNVNQSVGQPRWNEDSIATWCCWYSWVGWQRKGPFLIAAVSNNEYRLESMQINNWSIDRLQFTVFRMALWAHNIHIGIALGNLFNRTIERTKTIRSRKCPNTCDCISLYPVSVWIMKCACEASHTCSCANIRVVQQFTCVQYCNVYGRSYEPFSFCEMHDLRSKRIWI